MRMFRPLASIAIASLLAASAAAQDTSAGARTDAPRTTALSFQPFSFVRQVYQAELERSLGNTITLGLAASYWQDDDDEVSYLSSDLKFRYYPGGRPLEGFSFGMSAGVGQFTDTLQDGDATDVGPSMGAYVDYGWLLGPTRRFYTSLGVGAKALFIDYDVFGTDFNLRYPTVRASVGYAF